MRTTVNRPMLAIGLFLIVIAAVTAWDASTMRVRANYGVGANAASYLVAVFFVTLAMGHFIMAFRNSAEDEVESADWQAVGWVGLALAGLIAAIMVGRRVYPGLDVAVCLHRARVRSAGPAGRPGDRLCAGRPHLWALPWPARTHASCRPTRALDLDRDGCPRSTRRWLCCRLLLLQSHICRHWGPDRNGRRCAAGHRTRHLTVALLLPVTFKMDPGGSLIMFAGIYYGGMYGGSTTAILLNTPGEAASVVTALEGNKMARAGRGGPALATAAIGSFVAALVATFGLAFLSPDHGEGGCHVWSLGLFWPYADCLRHRLRDLRLIATARADQPGIRTLARPYGHRPTNRPSPADIRRPPTARWR